MRFGSIPQNHASRHQNGGVDEINVAGLSGELADDQPVKASDAVSKQFCRIKTGQYTGDGSTSQAITGVGFQPKYAECFPHVTVAGAAEIYQRITNMVFTHQDNSGSTMSDNRIDSLDSDGFTVDDAGADAHPNKNGQVYDYIALG